jgi:hypothetical protein
MTFGFISGQLLAKEPRLLFDETGFKTSVRI